MVTRPGAMKKANGRKKNADISERIVPWASRTVERPTDVVGAVAEIAIDDDEVVGRAVVERGAQCLAEHEVHPVAQHADMRIAGGHLLREVTGSVGAAVVDDDDLPGEAIVERVH